MTGHRRGEGRLATPRARACRRRGRDLPRNRCRDWGCRSGWRRDFAVLQGEAVLIGRPRRPRRRGGRCLTSGIPARRTWPGLLEGHGRAETSIGSPRGCRCRGPRCRRWSAARPPHGVGLAITAACPRRLARCSSLRGPVVVGRRAHDHRRTVSPSASAHSGA